MITNRLTAIRRINQTEKKKKKKMIFNSCRNMNNINKKMKKKKKENNRLELLSFNADYYNSNKIAAWLA